MQIAQALHQQLVSVLGVLNEAGCMFQQQLGDDENHQGIDSRLQSAINMLRECLNPNLANSLTISVDHPKVVYPDAEVRHPFSTAILKL